MSLHVRWAPSPSSVFRKIPVQKMFKLVHDHKVTLHSSYDELRKYHLIFG